MTSVLPEEDSNLERMKQKLMNDSLVKEETRSFLRFSRENLSISHSDLEQGFNKSRIRPSKNTILSTIALAIGVLCFGLQIWNLHYSRINAHEIKQLKRDVEDLKHWFREQDTMDILKAFKEQLYAEESTEDDDSGETDIDNADYDSNYDDDDSASHDYSGDYHTPSAYHAKSSDFPGIITTTSIPISTSPNSDSNKTYFESVSHKVKIDREQEFERKVRGNYKSNEGERLKEEHQTQMSHEEGIHDMNSTKHGRNIRVTDTAKTNYTESASQEKKGSIKLKRSVSAIADRSIDASYYRHDGRYHAKRNIVSRTHSSGESKTNDNSGTSSTQSTVSWDGHPPKKYYTHAHLESSAPTHESQLSEEIVRATARSSEDMEGVGRRNSWRNAHHNVTGRRAEIRKHFQVYAIHYGADSTLFTAQDEYTENGRVRHSEGIFKAWRPSNWVAELGMNRHFTLNADGKLNVHESGLYLAYAQIHYLDEHDENGFRLLVNDRSILQCMVYSPGIGHKSRSCFSAQVTYLQADDHLVLKDVVSSRYTLFQHDKSFFGLVKLGEARQQQRHQATS